jgi:hypothetical protein
LRKLPIFCSFAVVLKEPHPPPEERTRLILLRRELSHLDELIAAHEKALASFIVGNAELHARLNRLMTIPGVSQGNRSINERQSSLYKQHMKWLSGEWKGRFHNGHENSE